MPQSTVPVRVPSTTRLMLRIQRALDSASDLAGGLEAALELVTDEVDADSGRLWVFSGDAADRDFRIEVRPERALAGARSALETIEGAVASGAGTVTIDDLATLPSLGPAQGSMVALPLRQRLAVVGVLSLVRAAVRPFEGADLDALNVAADKLAGTIEREGLLRQRHLDVEERELLVDINQRVARTLELDSVLAQVFDALLPVVPFDASAIFLGETGGGLSLSAQRGYNNQSILDLLPDGEGIVGQAMRQQTGIRVGDVTGAPGYLNARPTTRSEMAVPIRSGGQSIGVINLESDRPNAYTDRDQRIAEMIAGSVSSAIVLAQLHQDRIERSRVDHELALARELQHGLFPKSPPDHPAIDVHAMNLPSSAIGGDYYDYLISDSGALWLALADVSGHGLSAALLTGVTQTGFRLLAPRHDDPAHLAKRLNTLLHGSTLPGQHVAAVLSVLDLDTGVIRYCNAGHLPAAALCGDQWLEMRGGGVPLGLFADASYETHELTIEPGALLAYYTDGIPETEDPDGEEFGIERLRELLAAHPALPVRQYADLVRNALSRHRGHRGGYADDLTLMTARWAGPRA